MGNLKPRTARRRPPVPESLGKVLTRLAKPEPVAQITVAEATEITARNVEAEFVNAQAQHYARIAALLRNEKTQFIRNLCRDKGLDIEAGEFDINTEAGVIYQTATIEDAKPAELHEVKAAEPESNGEATPEEDAKE